MKDSALVKIPLKEDDIRLLREVLEKRAPGLLTTLRRGSEVIIREDQKKDIQELIGDELAETGFRADHEPNQRGLHLEKLIDAFSPYK